MEFTGLRDRNGKEIYEGDIVHYDAACLGLETNGYRTTVVEYKAPQFYPYHLGNVSGYDLEIIGNIHENPDLLKAEEEKR